MRFGVKGKVPLERALSKLGIASRTKAKEWILEGRLQVNGKVELNPKALVVPEKSVFMLDGESLRVIKKTSVVMLHKTKGVLTTCSDEKGRNTVYDLLPKEFHSFHPVGRLDMHTTGLLLFTNDTKISSYLTNPSNRVPRVYVVCVRGLVTEEKVLMLLKGIEDLGEKLQAQKIVIQKSSGKESCVIVTLVEGKNREIRRMWEKVGNEVFSLKRISFGSLLLGDLSLGDWRELSEKEIDLLRR